MMTDFDEWQSWNPVHQTFDWKKMANLQKLQSERLAIPRDNGVYYKRYLQHKTNLSFDGKLLSSFKNARPDLDHSKFSFERRQIGQTISIEPPSPTALRLKMTDSPNRLHVNANFSKDQKNIRKEIKTHKDQMLKEIKELRARSSKVYNKMQEQREYNKTLSPRNTVLQALAKNGLRDISLQQQQRPKSGFGLVAALNQKIKGRDTPLSTRDDSKQGSRPSSSFSRNNHFPRNKTQAFTKQSLKQNFLDQPLNNIQLFEKNGRKAATEQVSPRSKTVLSNY